MGFSKAVWVMTFSGQFSLLVSQSPAPARKKAKSEYREHLRCIRARSCVERLPALAGIPLLIKSAGNDGLF